MTIKDKRDEMTELAKKVLGKEAGKTTPKKLMEAVKAQGKRISFDVAKAVYMRLRREEAKAATAGVGPGSTALVTLGEAARILPTGEGGALRHRAKFGKI